MDFCGIPSYGSETVNIDMVNAHNVNTQIDDVTNTNNVVICPDNKQQSQSDRVQCKVCLKWYRNQQSLSVHERVHTKVRPFHCAHCKKRFSTAGNLKAHERIHSGEKPFKCKEDNCGKVFAEINTLKKHAITHSGVKAYSCSICKRNFSQLGSRNVHVKKNHPEYS